MYREISNKLLLIVTALFLVFNMNATPVVAQTEDQGTGQQTQDQQTVQQTQQEQAPAATPESTKNDVGGACSQPVHCKSAVCTDNKCAQGTQQRGAAVNDKQECASGNAYWQVGKISTGWTCLDPGDRIQNDSDPR